MWEKEGAKRERERECVCVCLCVVWEGGEGGLRDMDEVHLQNALHFYLHCKHLQLTLATAYTKNVRYSIVRTSETSTRMCMNREF